MASRLQTIFSQCLLPKPLSRIARMVMTELPLRWGTKRPWCCPPEVRIATSVSLLQIRSTSKI